MTTPNEITTILAETSLRQRLDKTKIEYSDKSLFNLNSIDVLTKKEIIKLFKDLQNFNMDDNSIPKLVLKGYNNLIEISAQNNLITFIDFNLTKLQKLNLSNNFIKEIYDLNLTPCLIELKLAENSINFIQWESFRPVKSTLTTFDISSNKIDFSDCNKFLDFAKNFAKTMKKLDSFNIIGNPFTLKSIYKDYSLIMIFYFEKTLVLFNNKDNNLKTTITIEKVALLEKKMKNSEDVVKKSSAIMQGENNNFDEGINVYVNNNNINEIELSFITNRLKKFTTMGKMTISTLKELNSLVNQFLNRNKQISPNENEDLEDLELVEFDNLLDLIAVLIDTSPMFEKTIYFIVCDFINYQNGKFSVKILTFLKQRIFLDQVGGIQNTVLEHLERRIDFRNKSVENIPSNLIMAMETLLQNIVFRNRPSFIEVTKKLIEYISNIDQDVKFINCRFSKEFKIKDTYYSVIYYLNTAARIKEHFILMIENTKFLDKISKQIKAFIKENFSVLITDDISVDTFMNLMRIMNDIFTLHRKFIKNSILKKDNYKNNKENSKENIDNKKNKKDKEFENQDNHFDAKSVLNNILGGGLRDKIEQNINKQIQEMVKNSNSKDFNVNKNKILYGMIRFYGGLISESPDLAKFIKDDKSMPFKIINFLVVNDTYDPIFIQSCCEFVLNLLQNENILKFQKNSGEFKKILKNLYGLRYVLPYLVYDTREFNNCCYRAEKYGDSTILRAKPTEFQYLYSDIINNMIISIVKLIEFFGVNSKIETNITEDCKAFCKELQDQNKNFILFCCLNVPNENVKKAIVESLYSTDCSNFQTDEISQISKQLMETSLTGEYTESILSTMFIMLDQTFKNFILKNEIDRIKQNKEIFNLAMDILMKNNERIVTLESLYKKKVMLNCAISTFLINICRYQVTTTFFKEKSKSNKFCEILQMEEKNIFPTKENSKYPYYIPIEIEKIRSGFVVENFMNLITNENYLTPFTYISSRVLIHIADLLMNIKTKEINVNTKLDFDTLMKEIELDFSEREYMRIRLETFSFQKFIKFIESKDEEPLLTNEELKTEQMTFLNRFDLFLKYFKGETNNNINLIFNGIWKNKCDPKFEDENINENENKQRERIENEVNYKEIFDKSNLLKESYKSAKLDIDIKNEYISTLRKVEYTSLSNNVDKNTFEIKGDYREYQSYGLHNYSVVRHKKEEDPNNPFLRSLFLAAFLRCIYALLERPAETKVKDLMIEKLIEKNNLREITKFCETCISGEFNIPSKFISIVKFIVLNGNKNKNQFLNKNNNNYNNNSNSNNNKKNNSPNLYSNKSLNKKYHDSNKDSEDEDIENEEDKGLNKIEYEKIEDKNNMYIANLLKTILMKMKGKLTIEKDDDKILLNNICECAKALVMNIDYNHMEIDRISKNYINISKKYILSRKLKDYCDIIIIETFLEVIKEYMFLENLYFKKNSRSKEKDNEPKNANNPNQNGNGENFLLALNNNNEKDDIENEDILLLNERFEESNQIKILKIFANINEVENSEPGAFFKVDEYLLNLISYIPLILGEYMSKCSDETVSEIFEFFSRSSVFHGVNIRKSYIKEIIDLMNISKKNKLMSKEHINQFITRVNKIDFEKKDNKWCLLFVQENDLKLIPINENDNEKDDLINKDKLSLENEKEDDLINEITRKCIFNNEDENKISYDIITHIFVFELRNLLIFRLQEEKAVYKLFFFKRFYIAEIICNYIKMKKCNVKIIMDIPVFLNDEELSKLKEPDNIKEKILSNEKKLNQENFERKIIQDENETPENDNYNKNNKSTPTPIEENKNSTPSNSNNNDKEIKKMEEKAEKLINENEEEKKNLEKIQEEKRIKNFKKDPTETVIMYCNIPMSSFFDFFLNLFRNKKDIEESNINNLKEMRILKVNGQKFEIYDEISDNFFEMNFQKFNEETPIYEITTEIKKCFTLRESIDMSEFTDVEYKYNSVTINFNGKKFEINCFDDFSLIKLKTCLFYHKMKDVSIINKEDYSIIDKKA